MKKTALSVALFIFSYTAFFAAGFGAQLNIHPKFSKDTNSLAGGASFSFRTDKLPLAFNFETNYDFLSDTFDTGICADWWFCNPVIKGNWSFFAGAGIFIGTGMGKDLVFLAAAPRAVLGTNLTLLDGFLELFVQAAAQPSLRYDFQNAETDFNFTVPAAVGIRLWN